MTADLSQALLGALDALSGLHPGHRPVHAKGAFCVGTFTPAAAAAGLTRAPHASRPSTPVIARFSDAPGLPTAPDNDPGRSSPRGLAVRFTLGDHVHTDIVGHSTNGFPAKTGEEFLAFLRAAASSGPDAPKPTPIEKHLAAHPHALRFVQAPKPIPVSFATEPYFAITAFRFVNADGVRRFGRFQVRPQAGEQFLSAEEAAARSPNFLFEELPQRLAAGPIKFDVVVQLADAADDVADASTPWPDGRPTVPFGTVALTGLAEDSLDLRRVIFDPVPRVDGIEASPDPLIEVRSDLYLVSGRRRRAAGAK